METNKINRIIDDFLREISMLIETKVKYLNLKSDYDKKIDIKEEIDRKISNRIYHLKSLGTKIYIYDRRLKELLDQINQCNNELRSIKNKMDFAYSQYKSSKKTSHSFCYNLNKNYLRSIINYFDMSFDLDKNPQKEIISFIIEFVSEDIEKIRLNFSNFSYRIYRGPITLIEIILGLKKKCEIDIKNCKDLEKRLVELGLTEQIYANFYLNLEGEFRNLQTSMFNLTFRKKLIETLSKEEYDKYVQMSKITSEKYELLGQYEEVKQSKKISYERYKNASTLIPTLIDKLGEKTLKQLIQYLNINIDITEDNYFNEKEEMIESLKEWFKREDSKILKEFEESKRDIVESDSGINNKVLNI